MAKSDEVNDSVKLWDFLLSETRQPNFFDLLFHIEILIGLKSLPCDNQATKGRDINCLSPGKVSVKIVSADNEIL